MFQKQLKTSLTSLEETDCYRVERGGPRDGSELWRISLRVGALSNVDYGQFVDDLRQTVAPVLNAYRARSMILEGMQKNVADGRPEAQQRVLFIGLNEPKSLKDEELLDRSLLTKEGMAAGQSKSAVRTDAIYASTLADLMRAEKIKRPSWIEVGASPANLSPGSERWNKLISVADCVVLINDHPDVNPEALAKSAKCFVDARLAKLPVAEPILNASVPVDANPGPLEAIYTGIVPVVYKSQRTCSPA